MEQRLGKRAQVQRNLFGTTDREQLQQDFECMLHSSVEQAQQKWNFDFLQDVPVEWLLKWEELQGHEVPAFYHSHMVGDSWRPLQHMNCHLCREITGHHFAQETLTKKSSTARKTGSRRIL